LVYLGSTVNGDPDMQKVISCYADGPIIPSFRNQYTMLKFGKPKHRYYLRNRYSNEIVLDQYDKYLIENCQPGHTIYYDSSGYYMAGVLDNLTVVELKPIVLKWYPEALIDDGSNDSAIQALHGTADNFIINNTIRLRYRTFEYYTNYWRHQTRFFKPGAQVFYSFRDIFIHHNKLKHPFSQVLQNWLTEMDTHGFKLVNCVREIIPITADMTELHIIPEVTDMVNGNVKLHWEYRP
jgi:hypothetical protein